MRGEFDFDLDFEFAFDLPPVIAGSDPQSILNLTVVLTLFFRCYDHRFPLSGFPFFRFTVSRFSTFQLSHFPTFQLSHFPTLTSSKTVLLSLSPDLSLTRSIKNGEEGPKQPIYRRVRNLWTKQSFIIILYAVIRQINKLIFLRRFRSSWKH